MQRDDDDDDEGGGETFCVLPVMWSVIRFGIMDFLDWMFMSLAKIPARTVIYI